MTTTMSKRLALFLLIAMMACLAVLATAPAHTAYADSDDIAAAVPAKNAEDRVDMNRLYNPYSGEHFYTADNAERDYLVTLGWRYEGTGWTAPKKGDPVYRLYNPYSGDHHYTMDASERDWLVTLGWNYEGVGWYSAPKSGARIALYREFNPNEEVGTHNYTTDVDEHVFLVSIGWNAEGAAWYALEPEGGHKDWVQESGAWSYYDKGKKATGWLVTARPPAIAGIGGGNERYWLGSDGALAVARLIDPSRDGDKKAGYLAYATSGGYVSRSTAVKVGETWYVADDDGKLSADAVASRLIGMAQGYASDTKYLIMVDVDDPRVVVLEGGQGNWKAKFVWDCCTGAVESPTVTGVFKVGIKGYSFGEDHGYSCYYYTQFYGNYLFHTRKYHPGTHELMDPSMGVRVSEGCVRLYDEYAKWIWDNVDMGTTVVCTE